MMMQTAARLCDIPWTMPCWTLLHELPSSSETQAAAMAPMASGAVMPTFCRIPTTITAITKARAQTAWVREGIR